MPWNPLHDDDLYHGNAPVDPNYPGPLRPSDAPAGSEGDSPADDGSSQDAAAEAPSYEDLTVEQLREEMRTRDIPYAGKNKAQLISELEADDETS